MVKINLNDPMHAECLSYRLTDEQRPYFGLNRIEDGWEEVEVKPGTVVYYEGDTIRKVIHYDFHLCFTYKEYDTEMHTNGRSAILPKTPRGKEKKITPSNILSVMPTGCTLIISLSSSDSNKSAIHAYNSRNSIRLPIDGDQHIHSLGDLEAWMRNYIRTCPPDYFGKVLRMRETPHRTIKYKTGDLFRFEIDREHYGYGLIIGKLAEMRKHVPESHPWHSMMTVPLLIRIYELKTKDRNMPVEEVSSHRLLRACMMSDGEIIWGTHEMIGNKTLDERDIDYPIIMERLRSNDDDWFLRFAWGFGAKEAALSPEDELFDLTANEKCCNRGVYLGLPMYQLVNVLHNKPQFTAHADLLHPDNAEIRAKVFERLGLSPDTSMDAFNRAYGGLTREQYATLCGENNG